MTTPILLKRKKRPRSFLFTILGITFMTLLGIALLILNSLLSSLRTTNDSKSSASWRRASSLDNLVSSFHQRDQPGHRERLGPATAKKLRRKPTPGISLRNEFEKDHDPNDIERLLAAVEKLRQKQPETQTNMSYNVLDCPHEPPPGYPQHWNSLEVLESWNVDTTSIPDRIYQGLCVFDWARDQDKAENYLQKEQPFVVQNHPEFLRASERWSSDDTYLSTLVGSIPQRNEHAVQSNHLMFWRKVVGNTPDDWSPPTENVLLTYDEWYTKAVVMEKLTDEDQITTDHWYFRFNGAMNGPNSQLFDELPMFRPDSPSMFMVDPSDAKGIKCRFGMKGAVAEAHFDSSRNWIAVMKGQRRYILAHPEQCHNMELYPVGHPSARHSMVDWSHPPSTGPFRQALLTEVVLQPGDALYLPTNWFHFIVSLNMNAQCNARSGASRENEHFMADCGFSIS